MMTPENEHETKALEMIGVDDILRVVKKWGGFGNEWDKAQYEIAECKCGFFRPFESKRSLMFVIKDKEEIKNK